jgi:putative hydrolase of HD superfamily
VKGPPVTNTNQTSDLAEAPIPPDLRQALAFLIEVDRLKTVLRRTLIADASRHENSAEHSWHVALMALVLAPHAADPGTDILRSVKMLLCHDIVEADCGDTFCYDDAGMALKEEKEQAAATRLFGLLPAETGAELRGLWDEFEARATPESRYANALDRLQPMILNHCTEGHSWRTHGITAERVLARNCVIEDGSTDLWAFAQWLVSDARQKGWVRAT